MPKRCIGIDIGHSHLHAAQIVRTAEGFRLEKAFTTQTRRNTDSLPAILQSLVREHGFDRRAETAVCLPLQAFFFADVETDTGGLERIRAADMTELKDCFPIPAEDLIVQVCSARTVEGGSNSVLVAASSRPQLRAGLQLLDAGGIKPASLDTPMTAVHRAVLLNHPEAAKGLAVILYLEGATLSLAVMDEGGLLLVRNIPLPGPADRDAADFARQTADLVAAEIEITWRRLFDSDAESDLRIFLAARDERTDALASCLQDKIDARVLALDLYAHLRRSDDVKADGSLGVAAGLALRVLQPEKTAAVNFLAAYRARTRPAVRIGRELAVCGALAAAAGLVWVAGLFLQLSSLEASYRQLKKEAVEVFRQAAPEEQNIVDPAAQLQQRLDAFRKECETLTCLRSGRPAPLEILYALSRNTPATGSLQLQDVLIAADAVRIKGSCDSFATLVQWQRLLEAIPGLRVVDVPRPTKDAQSGKVQFTISLSTRENNA